MIPKRLELQNGGGGGAGMEIYADIPKPIDFPEATMKATFQPVLVACAPWTQFPNREWDGMLQQLFQEMVFMWNENHEAEVAAKATVEAIELNDCGYTTDVIGKAATNLKLGVHHLQIVAAWYRRFTNGATADSEKADESSVRLIEARDKVREATNALSAIISAVINAELEVLLPSDPEPQDVDVDAARQVAAQIIDDRQAGDRYLHSR